MVSILGILDRFRNSLKPFYLLTYRGAALVIISGSLLFALSWGIIIFFFIFNNSWIAPTVLTSSNDRALQFNQGLALATQTIETDKVTLSQANRDLLFAQDNVNILTALKAEMYAYTNSTDSLSKTRQEQINQAHKLEAELDRFREQVKQAKLAGLIDNQTYTQTLVGINQFEGNTTSSQQSLYTLDVTTASQIIQLIEQLQQSQNDVHTKEETVAAATKSLVVAEQAYTQLTKSVYYDAFNDTDGNLNLAFIPYEGRQTAVAGAPIYQCTLEIIWCHKVGTVRHVYRDEQLVDFPIFNVKLSRTVRGVFVSVNADDKDAMLERVLFIGKPLWF